MRRLVLLAAVAALAGPGSAAAGDGFFVGVADDGLKHEPGHAAAALRDAGAGAVRLSLQWSPGRTALTSADRTWLERALRAARPELRLVLSVYGTSGSDAPQDDAARDEYCGYVRDALAHAGRIRDVVIWNEVNKSHFWQPQFEPGGASAAPAAYAALLARCWDVLHAFRPDVNLLTSTSSRGNDDPGAASNVSHSPGAFVRALGAAYRASGRTAPILDTVGHHPYGEHSAERPWRRHPLSATIGQGDWDKLVQAYHDAFAGTVQPSPGRCVAGRCTSIWYMEVGYQTVPDAARAGLYHGAENTPFALPADAGGDPAGSSPSADSPAPDHVTQLVDAVRLARCQPYVEAYFTFLLRDEHDLARWQSGLFWADWTPKPAAAAYAAVAREAAEGRVDCHALKGLTPVVGGAPTRLTAAGLQALFPAPRTDVPVLRVAWPAARTFNWRNDLWRFRLTAGEQATYRATIVRVGVRRNGRWASVAPRPVRTTTGTLRLGWHQFVTFPRGRLPHGARYRMEIVLTSAASPGRTTRLVGPVLTVSPRPSAR